MNLAYLTCKLLLTMFLAHHSLILIFLVWSSFAHHKERVKVPKLVPLNINSKEGNNVKVDGRLKPVVTCELIKEELIVC